MAKNSRPVMGNGWRRCQDFRFLLRCTPSEPPRRAAMPPLRLLLCTVAFAFAREQRQFACRVTAGQDSPGSPWSIRARASRWTRTATSGPMPTADPPTPSTHDAAETTRLSHQPHHPHKLPAPPRTVRPRIRTPPTFCARLRLARRQRRRVPGCVPLACHRPRHSAGLHQAG